MSSDVSAVAIILAAGFSHRFGVRDKRSIVLPGGQTLLAVTYARVNSVFRRTWVVIRDHDDEHTLGLPTEADIIRTSRAALGQGASLSDGFRYLLGRVPQKSINVAAVFLADMPLVSKNTCELLLAEANENRIVRPVLCGQAGHPVLFGRQYWPDLAASDSTVTGAKFIRQHVAQLTEVEVSDNGVCLDVDVPADVSRIITINKD